MLYVFGFDRVAVLAADLYFVNPDPEEGQEGPEQGVRLEVREVVRHELPGSIYSAPPIALERPLWRADLLESVSNPGSLDRAHHHPRFSGWEPGRRHFVEDMTADPLTWVAERLADLPGLLAEAGMGADAVTSADASELRRAVPEIMEAVTRLLEGVRAGELAPHDDGDGPVRVGWL